jgi:hypothetical protein
LNEGDNECPVKTESEEQSGKVRDESMNLKFEIAGYFIPSALFLSSALLFCGPPCPYTVFGKMAIS